jgi:endonuclease/exonuclease/phosphatase (EEP) superfamily protein YafD
MTYNVLGNQNQTPPLISVIRHENPDVLFIQELNPDLALVLEDELLYQYPYQILAPERGVRGMGVISKFPLEESGSQLPLGWVGKPQLINMNWQGQEVILVNFHMFPSGIGSPDRVAEVFRAREEQARVLAAFASQARVHHPIVVAGDANVTDLSQAYKILSEELSDAWRQAGSGFGHTFPGSDGPGSSRPRIAGWSVPRWLARIDYIFFSQQWEILTARLAQVDGVSDHRGVIAVLVLE